MLENVEIIVNTNINGPYYYLEVLSPTMTSQAVPGQFLHIRPAPGIDPLLRRPLSIHRIYKEKGSLGVLYQVKGHGTALLSKRQPTERLDVLGPCGRGFLIPSTGPVLVVAGGIGIAPLFPLVQQLTQKGVVVDLLLGAGRREDLLCREELVHPLLSLHLATEDGSLGLHGLVTDLLKVFLQKKTPVLIYGCGPVGLLKQLVSISSKEGIPCQISLEGRMGCGMGFCLGCAVKKKDGHGYHRLCTEGPVFHGEEVSFDED